MEDPHVIFLPEPLPYPELRLHSALVEGHSYNAKLLGYLLGQRGGDNSVKGSYETLIQNIKGGQVPDTQVESTLTSSCKASSLSPAGCGGGARRRCWNRLQHYRMSHENPCSAMMVLDNLHRWSSRKRVHGGMVN